MDRNQQKKNGKPNLSKVEDKMYLIGGLLVIAVVLLVNVFLWRWIFRINDIVYLLRKIDFNTSKAPPPVEKATPEPEGHCEACKKYLPKTELQTITINGAPKIVCPDCKKFIQP